jgi:tripartite-type tricarboxylate transporter receptor subunit TctC
MKNMKNMKRLGALIVLMLFPTLVWAQNFPSKLVKITSPYSNGSGGDLYIRILAEMLQRDWQQPVVVEAKPGASGVLAINMVKRSPADGYQLLALADPQLTINPNLLKDIPYDTEKDFVPIIGLSKITFFAVVKSDGLYQSMDQLIAAAKSKPDSVSFGIPALGSTVHMASGLFEHDTGTKMLKVPYREQIQMLTAIANGSVTWTMATSGVIAPMEQAGRLKVLAVAAKQRLPSRPDVPTMEEATGLKDFVVEHWIALFAPRDTPKETIAHITGSIQKAQSSPEMKDRINKLGFEELGLDAVGVVAKIRADLRKNAEAIKRTGMKIE